MTWYAPRTILATSERQIERLIVATLHSTIPIDVTAPIPANSEFGDQSLAKAHSLCLRIFAEYSARASDGKLGSIRRNRNNWKAAAAAECADAIAELDRVNATKG